jgi:hypothetical protein
MKQRAPEQVVLAEFSEEAALIAAATRAQEEGWRIVDMFSPHEVDFDLPGDNDVLRQEHAIRRDGLMAGVLAGLAVYLLLWWSKDVAFPILVGGRPDHPWPAFLLPAVEAGMLSAGAGGLVSFCIRNGFPALHHPVFDAEEFELATDNRFFLALAAEGDIEAIVDALRDAHVLKVQAARA